MRYSYNEFIKLLGLDDVKLAKTMYELYLDCLKKQSEE